LGSKVKGYDVNWGVHLAMVTVQFLFASLTVAAKFVLPGIPPSGIVYCRITGAALAFVIIKAMTVREEVTDRRDLFALAGLSLVGVVLNQLFFLEGVKRTTAINANILITTIPAFTLAIAIALKRERASAAKVLGIACAAAGALYLIGLDRLRLNPETAFGNALIVVNTSLYAFYLVLSKRLLERYHPVTVVTYVFLFGALLIAPFGVTALRGVHFASQPASVVIGLVYIVIFPSILAYYLSVWALRRTASSLVAMYVYLQPLMTALGAPLILHERVTARGGLAAVLIFTGLALATWGEQRGGRALGAAFRPPAEGA
jgi:drug/metabolite transporter (DMT)-like permease